jgi:Family of unknown function (DUF6461)
MPDLSAFAWAVDVEATCVAVAGGCTEDQLIDRYGGDPAAAVDATPGRVQELAADGGPVLFVRTVRDLVLAVEDNGWQGTRPEVLREVTTGGGRMISAFWNVNALTEINLAENGEVLVTFEDSTQRFGTDPDRLLPVLRQIGYPAEALGPQWKEWMLALVGAVTGVDVTSPVMDGPFRAVRLVPLPADLPTREGLATSYLRRQDPEVSAALDAATDEQLRRAAVAGARLTMAVAGLDREPVLLAALGGAERGEVGPVDRRSQLGRVLAGQDRRDDEPPPADPEEAEDRAFWQEQASNAVRAALAPDPLVAAHQAADQARVYLPVGAPARAAVLAALRRP